jgi:hypothetical protein
MPPLVMMYVASFSGISESTLLADRQRHCSSLHTWRVLYLCDALLASTFAK